MRQYASDMSYFSMNDPALLEAVRASPVGFIGQQNRTIVNEIQRTPQLLMVRKLAIDQDRRPGRFLRRDMRDIADIDHANLLPKPLALLAALSGQLLKLNQAGSQIGMDGKSVEKYIGILEKLFLVRRLLAFSHNTLNGLIKFPKIHFLDAGLLSTLTCFTPERVLLERQRIGATLET